MNQIAQDLGPQPAPVNYFPTYGPSTRASHCEAVKRVIEVMHGHLSEPLSLHEMGKVAFVSEYHFNRVFRQITGIPPCRFLYALRMEAAKRLLLTTQESVTDVCFEVGYNSLGTFIRRFNELLGLSPSRLRILAQSSLDVAFESLAKSSMHSTSQNAVGLTGVVRAPDAFHGLIFVGLFATRIPQGKPIVGTVISNPGPYFVPRVPDGRFYLFTAGLAWSKDPKDYLLYESALRGGGQPITVSRGMVVGSTNLTLRPPSPFDPPILLTLPRLIS